MLRIIIHPELKYIEFQMNAEKKLDRDDPPFREGKKIVDDLI